MAAVVVQHWFRQATISFLVACLAMDSQKLATETAEATQIGSARHIR
jgi:hypothetical protein